ncbi:hypothetical protein DPMN_136200 [Dreissena polymorpha]|uniref:Uncharacterized protein n=1 Tax=Dreissena polymorpha TaxID=45954 RepID=A0A9D4G368_DREPO|nr:hypothetical protein DPMN_136200 [Dreissena polymorpha]
MQGSSFGDILQQLEFHFCVCVMYYDYLYRNYKLKAISLLYLMDISKDPPSRILPIYAGQRGNSEKL